MSAFFVNYTENQEIWHVFRSACLQRFRHAEQQTSRQYHNLHARSRRLGLSIATKSRIRKPMVFLPSENRVKTNSKGATEKIARILDFRKVLFYKDLQIRTTKPVFLHTTKGYLPHCQR